MNFLNENFKSIDDLKRIDIIINDLNKEREDIENAILRKDNDDDLSTDLYDRIQLQSQEISQQLGIIVNEFLNKDLSRSDFHDKINALILEYGDIEFFHQVKNKVDEYVRLKTERITVEKYLLIYEEIENLPRIDKDPDLILSNLQKIHDTLQNIQAEESELKTAIVETINSKISNIITTIFKPIFMEGNEGKEIPNAPELKQLLVLQSLDPLNSNVRPLWCLQALIRQNFQLKFKFHYDSNQETNKLDKPEWFLKFGQDWLTQNLEDFNTLMSKIFQNTVYETYSFKEEYVFTIVELLSYKINKNIQLIYKLNNEDIQSNLFMHLIDEMLKNDEYYLQNFKININLVDKLILSNNDLKRRWLEFEKNFNFSKFNKIISNDEAFKIDFESVDASITKPTNSSILVKNLLNNLNLKYKLIKNLNFKLSLLTQIQLRILEKYYERLDELLIAFNNLFKKFKLLSGKSEDEELIIGIKGVDRLLRIYCSLAYIVEAMEMWNEDLLFIQLSNMIKEETFFNTLILGYQDLSKNVIRTIDDFLNKEINTNLKPFFKITNWSTLSQYNQNITPELSHGLGGLTNIINYLTRTLSQIDSIPILTNFEEKIIKFFNDNILNLNTFNNNGSLQCYFDFNQAIEILKLFKNLKNYLKFMEIFKFLSIVGEDVQREMNNSIFNNKFIQLCDENDLIILKQNPQLLLNIARRRVFN